MTIDALLTASLLSGASDALRRAVDGLADLHDGWVQADADPEAVRWLADVIQELGWWTGRLAAGIPDPTADQS